MLGLFCAADQWLGLLTSITNLSKSKSIRLQVWVRLRFWKPLPSNITRWLRLASISEDQGFSAKLEESGGAVRHNRRPLICADERLC
ncbi:hypothetical protein Caka_0700 [Coraliomargarita akajimensis DSM 45221]|uniref:Uncharacterized protein n=1 Tax=Coraliomargarita akajimensis (strain DSM 45221 / IAM 15411 / JCM 23193 / KCTC 12865 / 04OKA010-24) TaxID=583355 RepID=D5EPI7_CORAD|nr:hypothetical protein Caka_0700 [Coraliomargarita akajimensis DSM 45221]